MARVCVEGLGADVTKDDFAKEFGRYGKLTSYIAKFVPFDFPRHWAPSTSRLTRWVGVEAARLYLSRVVCHLAHSWTWVAICPAGTLTGLPFCSTLIDEMQRSVSGFAAERRWVGWRVGGLVGLWGWWVGGLVMREMGRGGARALFLHRQHHSLIACRMCLARPAIEFTLLGLKFQFHSQDAVKGMDGKEFPEGMFATVIKVEMYKHSRYDDEHYGP